MPCVARLRSAARSARLATGVLACLTLLVLVGPLANSSTAFAMSEKEFKEKCIAQGGVYSGPANDQLGAWGSQGAGTCSWTTCGPSTSRQGSGGAQPPIAGPTRCATTGS